MDPNLSVEQAHDLVTGWIDEYRTALASNYFTYNDHQWDCDQLSINNITGINVLGLLNNGNLPAGILWRDHNNQYVAINAAYMTGMANAYVAFLLLCYQAAWEHKANVLALNDTILIQDYDYQDSLWPNPNTDYSATS